MPRKWHSSPALCASTRAFSILLRREPAARHQAERDVMRCRIMIEIIVDLEMVGASLEARVDALERLAPQTSNPTPMATILARVDTLERRMREMELAR